MCEEVCGMRDMMPLNDLRRLVGLCLVLVRSPPQAPAVASAAVACARLPFARVTLCVHTLVYGRDSRPGPNPHPPWHTGFSSEGGGGSIEPPKFGGRGGGLGKGLN